MTPRLKTDPAIARLAADLKLKGGTDPVAAIIKACRRTIDGYLSELPCDTLAQLLDYAAARLDTLFVELNSDEELRQIEQAYLARGEVAFIDLSGQLGPEVFAITFGLTRQGKMDRRFVSLIDCRGPKRYRKYFSKWHELAHLLTLTEQMQLRFCRTHADVESDKDPQEALMDAIGGELAFYPPLVQKHACGRISFAKIEELRIRLCQESSKQAAEIGIVKAWPRPVLLVRARVAARKRDRAASFDFHSPASLALRAVMVTVNEAAKLKGILLPPNMRVPERSIIFQAYATGADQPIAIEDLSWWESQGIARPQLSVQIETQVRGEYVDALVNVGGAL